MAEGCSRIFSRTGKLNYLCMTNSELTGFKDLLDFDMIIK